MEYIIIESKAFDKLKQGLAEILDQTEKLNRSKQGKEWLDNQDVCLLLGISLRTLQSYRDRGIIPYSMIEHKCYYKAMDVECLIEKNKVTNSKKQ